MINLIYEKYFFKADIKVPDSNATTPQITPPPPHEKPKKEPKPDQNTIIIFKKDTPKSDKNDTGDITLDELILAKPHDIADEISDENLATNKKIAPPKVLPNHAKPKLAIIIDDVATYAQIREIESIGYAITPSIMPPNISTPNTQKLAINRRNFMVHLPLEAKNFANKGLITLKTTDSYDKIDNIIAKVREDFPNAVYINNHTGSKFSSDEKAMQRLAKALAKHGFRYIDSRTIGGNASKNAIQNAGFRYAYRDIFIDNEANANYTLNQLKQAVAVAKNKGYAIAIGHPKPSTFKALKNAKSVLKDVECVYIKDIYDYYR